MKSTLGRKGDWLRETVDKLNAWGYGPRIRVRPWQRNKGERPSNCTRISTTRRWW